MNDSARNSGLIDSPPRESFTGSSIILTAVTIFSIALVIPGGGKWTLILLSLLLSAAVIGKYKYAVHVSLLSLLTFLPAQYVPSFRLWPFNLLVPLIVYGLIVSLVPALRRSAGWLKKGRTDASVFKIVIATSLLSTVALAGWVIIIRPDIEHHIAKLPELTLWLYPFAGLVFAVINAAMEETVFRGVVMEALDSALGAGYLSVCFQAISFAALHYLAGFPSGVTGFILTFIYGLILGAVRRFSQGMLASFIAHIAADMMIFSILGFIYFSSQ